MLTGLGLMPVVCGLTFGTLVIISEAALGPGLPKFGLQTLGQMAVDLGLLPAPATAVVLAPPVPAEAGSPAAPFVPPGSDLASPTATASPTTTATPTSTPTATATPTPTATETASATPTLTSTATATASSTATASPTQTATRTATRTATLALPTGTPTMTLTPTPSASPTEAPGSTATTETSVAATATDTLLPPTATVATACNPTGNADFESTLLGLINQERTNQGLARYSLQAPLQAAARLHSTDMACNDFLSHTGSDGSTVRDRIERQGYSWSWAGENIFATGDTSSNAPQRAFTWWMNSAPHRANLLSPNYTDVGLGYAYSADSSYGGYFTAVFARP